MFSSKYNLTTPLTCFSLHISLPSPSPFPLPKSFIPPFLPLSFATPSSPPPPPTSSGCMFTLTTSINTLNGLPHFVPPPSLTLLPFVRRLRRGGKGGGRAEAGWRQGTRGEGCRVTVRDVARPVSKETGSLLSTYLTLNFTFMFPSFSYTFFFSISLHIFPFLY